MEVKVCDISKQTLFDKLLILMIRFSQPRLSKNIPSYNLKLNFKASDNNKKGEMLLHAYKMCFGVK